MITILINKLTVFLESLEAKIMNEKVLLKSKHKDLIEDFIQRIKKNLDSIKNSYKTLVMYSQGKNYFGFDYMNEKSSKSKSKSKSMILFFIYLKYNKLFSFFIIKINLHD